MSSNLLKGTIAEAIFLCQRLKEIDVSRNSLQGEIPPSIGSAKNLQIIRFNENQLESKIPTALFDSIQIKELMIQSNELTGTIPTQVGNLKNATILTLSHNSLKGEIPKELQGLHNLKILHLQYNQLTGKAPEVMFQNFTKNSYITDCGSPSFLLDKVVECKTCTMCCNSEEVCQERNRAIFNIWAETSLVAALTLTAIVISGVIYLRRKGMLSSGTFFKDRDPKHIYSNGSVYCFILSNTKVAWFLYILTAVIQLWLFATYLHASNVRNEDTDFQFNFRCLGNSLECNDESNVGVGGWALFFIVLFLYIGRDLAMSCQQLLSALALGDFQLFVSGSGMLILTVVAIFTSFKYNLALATKNTDLVTNAVILLFINDLDESFLSFLQNFKPDFTDDVLEEVQMNLYNKKRVAVNRKTSVQPQHTSESMRESDIQSETSFEHSHSNKYKVHIVYE